MAPLSLSLSACLSPDADAEEDPVGKGVGGLEVVGRGRRHLALGAAPLALEPLLG